MKPIYFLPAITWLVISIILLTLPQKDLPQGPMFDLPYLDKYVHTCMFFLLTALFSYPFSKASGGIGVTHVFVRVAILVIIYGIIMEFVQKYFTQGRSFDIVDILFDCVGSILGLLAIRQYTLRVKNRPQ